MTPPAEQWWSPFKVVNDVTVVHVDLAPDSPHERAAFAWLDRSEQDQWRRF